MTEQVSDIEAEQLPEITKIDTTARVGRDRESAVVIWFGGGGALRYVWDKSIEEIREETYLDGTVHESFTIGGHRGLLSSYALESLSEYVNVYKDNPEAMEKDWPHVHELLMAVDERS